VSLEVHFLSSVYPGPLVLCVSEFTVESTNQSADARREWRHLFANVLQHFVVIRPRCERVEFTGSLLELCIQNMSISFEYVDKLRFYLGKDINPFDVRR
jgi:hypothetical protein